MNKGIVYTLLTILFDLLIASLIFIWLLTGDKNPIDDFIRFISDRPLHIGIAVFSLIIAGIYVGNYMRYLICVKKKDSTMIGMAGMMIILIIGILGGSSVGFYQEGITGSSGILQGMIDYYLKPLFWILIFGFIPTLISGWILGSVLKKTCYNIA